MEAIVKSDIFFFITSIAVILFTVIGVIAAVYIIKIVRDIRSIIGLARTQAQQINEDVNALRAQVKEEGARLKTLYEQVVGMAQRTTKRQTKTQKNAKKQ